MSAISGKVFSSILVLSAVVFGALDSRPAMSKAYYPTLRENIQRSDYIAVVSLSEPKVTDKKSGTWTYREVSEATKLKSVKGTLPEKFSVYGNETFICAQCRFTKGKALVFLRKSGELFTGNGWTLACLPISDGRVAWVKGLDDRALKDKVPLKVALHEIRKVLAEK